MEDIQATGALFTWSNKQEPVDRVYSRLDRAMGNIEWMESFGDYLAHFHPLDCLITLLVQYLTGRVRKYRGTKMFHIIKKLKDLKPVLKSLNKTCFSDIETSYNLTVLLLEKIQKDLIITPGNIDLMQQEYDVAQELKELLAARDSFLIQKAKLQWSLEGDINTAYFHNSIRKRMMQNKVLTNEY
ncbi:uncharacterized protein LOC141590155 [Silene latifolia]|uniref:uncharacterized protein LOC141590155 n=1 Tax=Silene latifolia TaxID=37657 RepID=UPI003D7881B6